MISKLDKKTLAFIAMISFTSIVAAVILVTAYKEVALALTSLLICLISCILLVQVNLDKRFIQVTTSKLFNKQDNLDQQLLASIASTEQIILETRVLFGREFKLLNSEFSKKLESTQQEHNTRLSYELAYANKQFSDDLRLLEQNHVRWIAETKNIFETTRNKITSIEDKISEYAKLPTGIEQVNPASVQMFQVGPPTIGRGVVANHGRGSAAAPKDPLRHSKISRRMVYGKNNLMFLIGSDDLKSYLELKSDSSIFDLYPNTAADIIGENLSDAHSVSRPLLVIEPNALLTGPWNATMSASGARLYAYLESIIKEIKRHNGFSFLVGEFETKNTFTSSIEGVVDSHLTREDMTEDWAYDAKLAVPRLFQNFLMLEDR
ncbi:hypothetical protein [Glutamicibacter ardleyensis]|uniref:hypothetical protein n=1 Tax=Glutamicibacter ardleyensis TaxID=225894 RepID=UPI003FCFAEE8